MRCFVFFLLATVVYAAPQGGYNYQIQFDSAVRNELTHEQYQLLQQYAQQQLTQQPQQQVPLQPQQTQIQPQVLEVSAPVVTTSQTVTQDNENGSGGYHFANQLAQQGHQLVKFEQEQQQQQQPLQQLAQPETVAQNVEFEIVKQPAATSQKQEEPQTQLQSQPIPQPRYESTSQQYHVQHERHHHPVQYNKEFYYLSAPQEDFEHAHDLDNQLDNLKKNIRVLFIRAPEQNGLANAALQLAKQSMDQQTVVYVLTKQHDTADLAHKLQQVRNSAHSKPDVIFVKYKTPEEAEHAQRTIQSQYEALDGPNHFNHQGVVSTHDFVGSTGHHHANRVHIDPRKSTTSAEAEAPSSKYLPSAAKL